MTNLPYWKWPPILEPELPRLDPVTYAAEYVPPNLHIQRPSDPVLDRLYRAETVQLRKLGGLRTWEAVAFQGPAGPGDDEARLWSAEASLEPDESAWFSIFTRSHWCNVDQRVLDTFPDLRGAGFTESDTWSVDDPRIWRELGKTIQLANAMLNTAAEGEWLQNALSFEHHYRLLGTDAFQKNYTAVPRLGIADRQTADGVRAWIDSDAFSKHLKWSLISLPQDCEGGNREGMTHSTAGFPYYLINLEVTPLFPMLDPTFPPTQAAAARLSLATTMLHELAHAMIGMQLKHLPHPQPDSGHAREHYYHEPFYNGENLGEVGHSFINSAFAADVWHAIQLKEWPARSNMCPYWLFQAAPWPEYADDFMISGDLPTYTASDPAVSAHAAHPIPGGWIRAVQMDDFWIRDVTRYGLKALHFPRVFTAQNVTFRRPFNYGFCRSVRFDDAALEAQPLAMRAHLAMLGKTLQSMRKGWASMRPWQRETRVRWTTTPWGHVAAREDLETLVSHCFALPRTARKENEALDIAYRLGPHGEDVIMSELSHHDPEKARTDVKITRVSRDAKVRCVKAWLYMAVAKMVLGSLPPCEAQQFPRRLVGPVHRYHNSSARADDPRRPEDWPEAVARAFAHHETIGMFQPGFELEDRHPPGLSTFLVRSTVLATGFAMLADYYLIVWCCPVGLRNAWNREYSKIMAQLRAYEYAEEGSHDGYLDFGFVLPPYVDKIQGVQQVVGIATYATYARRLLEEGPPTVRLEGEDPLEMWSGLPVDDGLRPSVQSVRVARQTTLAYLTIAEIYDVRRRYGSGEHVLVRSGLELEVYDQIMIRRVLGISREQLVSRLEHSSYGWCLDKAATAAFMEKRSSDRSETGICPLARVVQWVTPEEVAMMNGQNGRPTWITACDQVYDVSDLAFEPQDDKLVQLLQSEPGGNPMLNVWRGGYQPREVVEGLRDYRVAMVLPTGMGVAPETVRTFTSEELGWHEFRETGMYIQIYDDVYDVGTAYLEMHPGGLDLLAAYAGRDATKAFEAYHPENGKELLESVQALKIGRMIKTYQPGAALAPGEVRIRDRVFFGEEARAAVKGINGTPSEEFEAALLRIADGGPDEPIVTLWNKHQDLVIAQFAAPAEKLPGISEAQLLMFDGIFLDECFENAAFMAVDGIVFDITTLLRHGHPAMVDVLWRYAGGKCADEKVGEIVKSRYPFRAVARVSESEEEEGGVAWSPRMLRHDIENAKLQKLAKGLFKPKREKKRKFEPIKIDQDHCKSEPRLRMPVPAEEMSAKRRATGEAVQGQAKWLDWRTEGLIEKLQQQFATSGVLEQWQAREQARFGDEAKEMEGYWAKVGEGVGA